MIDLARKKAQPPVKAGEVIERNILGTGADMIATRDLLE
jgi:CxxC motif-containing protein